MREAFAWILAGLGAIAAFIVGLRFSSQKEALNDERKGRVRAELGKSAAEEELAVSRETVAARAETAAELERINTEVRDGLDPDDPYGDINDTLGRLGNTGSK